MCRNHLLSPAPLFALAISGLSILSSTASAIPVSWASSTSGHWEHAINWSPAGVPAGNDDVKILVNSQAYIIEKGIAGPTVPVKSLHMDASRATLRIAANQLRVNQVFSLAAGKVLLSGGNLSTGGGLFIGPAGEVVTPFGGQFSGNIVNDGSMSLGRVFLDGTDGASGAGILTNSGTIDFKSSGQFNRISHVTVNNGVFNADGGDVNGFTNHGILNVQGTSYPLSRGSLELTNADLVNDGTINLVASLAQHTPHAGIADLPGFSGKVLNLAGGVINSLGDNGRIRGIYATLDNRGLVNVAQSLQLGRDSLNSGVIQLGGSDLNGGRGTLHNSGLIQGNGNLTFDSLDNARGGRVDLASGDLALSGDLNNDGSIAVRNGDVSIRHVSTVRFGGDFTVAAGHSLRIDRGGFGNTDITIGPGATLQGGGTLQLGGIYGDVAITLQGDYSPETSHLVLENASVQGPGALHNRSTMEARSASLYGAVVNESGASAVFHGGVGALLGFSNAQGGLARFEASTGYGDSYYWINNSDLVNRGRLEMGSDGVSGGRVILSRYYQNHFGTGRLVNEASGTVDVQGGGVRDISAGVVNRGLFNVGADASWDAVSGVYSNSGVLNLADGATLTVQGDTFTNEVGGVISGNGTLDTRGVNFLDQGMLSPGNSFGQIDIVGDYVQDPGAILEMEIGATGHDLLTVSNGTATLNGILRLVFVDGFAPQQNDLFDLILGDVVENFSAIELVNLEDGFLYDLSGGGAGLRLTALNDAVYRAPGGTGGGGSGTGGGATVPEAGIPWLLALGLGGMVAGRRLSRGRRGGAGQLSPGLE